MQNKFEHQITFMAPLTIFGRRLDPPVGGLDVMAADARKMRDAYDGKSSAHWQAWENLAVAIQATCDAERSAESTNLPKRVISREDIQTIMLVMRYHCWTAPYEREGSDKEHLDNIIETLGQRGIVVK